MGEWIDELAEAFGLPPLSAEESGRLLRVAREVAHRQERKATPLAAFLLGLDVAERMAAGAARADAIAGALATVERSLPPPTPDGG